MKEAQTGSSALAAPITTRNPPRHTAPRIAQNAQGAVFESVGRSFRIIDAAPTPPTISVTAISSREESELPVNAPTPRGTTAPAAVNGAATLNGPTAIAR